MIKFLRTALLLFIFNLSVLAAQAVYAVNSCQHVFASSPAPFFASLNPQQTDFQASKAILLGTGMTGTASLLQTPGGPAEFAVQKIYHSSEESALHYEADAQMLNFLAKNLKASDRTFVAVSAKSLGLQKFDGATEPHYAIETPYVPGRTLHSLLLDPAIPEQMKETLRNIYLEKLRKIQEIFKATYRRETYGMNLKEAQPEFFRDRQMDAMPILIGELLTNRFVLKSDNVIVDPFQVETMTIIDPY